MTTHPDNLPIRRRRLASFQAVPDDFQIHFTVGQLAALGIIGDEVRSHGRCELTIADIGARASVSRNVVQTAISEAERLRLLVIVRPAVVRAPRVLLVSDEWRAWLSQTAAVRLEVRGALSKRGRTIPRVADIVGGE